jgi:negative regulator of flagellin synthesis FlgM
MDIKGTNGIGRVDATNRVASDAPRGDARATPDAHDSADQLTLTPLMRRLIDAAHASGQGAPVDRARVEAIRDQIAQGSYEIDPERIAAALLRTEREMNR